MKIDKVLIFTSEAFPYGMAATNRIISYGKGFVGNGIDVEVLCLRRTENWNDIKNRNKKGNFEGIRFHYISGNSVKSKYFLLRRIHNFLSYMLIFFSSFKRIDNSTLSIYYSSDTGPLIIIWLVNKLKRGLLFKEESEHPQVYIQHKKFLSKYFFKNLHYQLFDGFLLMTKNLITYFSSAYRTPYLHIPMTVELDRFDDSSKRSNSTNTIVYTGFLSDEKDGIDLLLKAFAEVAQKHKDYRLHLYGAAISQNVVDNYHALINQLGISELVDFKGKVTREVITEKISEAKILVLPRPDSLQAQHGFPTKLGEYLATGNPTLVTSVGEIPHYLTDNKDCYMAAPGDLQSLKEKLLEILGNYNRAKMIGLEGRKIAEVHFNNLTQTKKIVETIENSFK